jgi:hypothetical protein
MAGDGTQGGLAHARRALYHRSHTPAVCRKRKKKYFDGKIGFGD